MQQRIWIWYLGLPIQVNVIEQCFWGMNKYEHQCHCKCGGDKGTAICKGLGTPCWKILLQLTSWWTEDLTSKSLNRNRSAARLAEILIEMPLYRDVSQLCGFRGPLLQARPVDRRQIWPRYSTERATGRSQISISSRSLPTTWSLTFFAAKACSSTTPRSQPASAPASCWRRARRKRWRSGRCRSRRRMLRRLLRNAGVKMTARQLDEALWTRGQLPAMKAHPPTSARTTNYWLLTIWV